MPLRARDHVLKHTRGINHGCLKVSEVMLKREARHVHKGEGVGHGCAMVGRATRCVSDR